MARSVSDTSPTSREANEESESFVMPTRTGRKKGQNCATGLARFELEIRKRKAAVVITSLLCIILILGKSYKNIE
jgi:hypothetical protein